MSTLYMNVVLFHIPFGYAHRACGDVAEWCLHCSFRNAVKFLESCSVMTPDSRFPVDGRVLQDDGTPAARAKARAQVTMGYKCSAN